MTRKPASHRPAPWRAKAAVLAAATIAVLGLSAVPAFAASAAPAAGFASTGPVVHEQQDLSQNVTIATGNVHTTLVSSPVLAEHSYLVNLAVGVNNIPAGAVVLCGLTTSTSGDIVTGNYGQVQNEASTASSGNCAVTGTVTIKNLNDQITAWATTYTGPGGAAAGDWSMNEFPAGSVVITH